MTNAPTHRDIQIRPTISDMALGMLCVMLATLLFMLPAMAQTETAQTETTTTEEILPQQAAEAPAATAETPEEAPKFRKQPINPNSIPSLLFTKWEYAAILEAVRSMGSPNAVRAPSNRELRDSEGPASTRYEQKTKPPPEERDISLSGIVYGGQKDWTFWLNGKRVTPDALPKEIIDIKVYKEYIEIKWYDEYSQSVYPIKLRPHQRFNLDTRIFLPG